MHSLHQLFSMVLLVDCITLDARCTPKDGDVRGCILKKNLHYTRGNMPKRVTSGGVHLRGLAPGQHSFEETSQRWRVVGDTASDLTGPGREPQTSRT